MDTEVPVSVAANRRGARATVSQDQPPAQRLLRAAEELFGECNYRRATVAGICARAGIATGSFYAHFRSTAEIFAAVVRQLTADLRQAMRSAIETSPSLGTNFVRRSSPYLSTISLSSSRTICRCRSGEARIPS